MGRDSSYSRDCRSASGVITRVQLRTWYCSPPHALLRLPLLTPYLLQGLGTYLGYFVSQNAHGHVLGHVKDLGEDSSAIDRVRIYRTNARQFFHADDSDLVGLLCIAKALEGGESDLVSSHAVWNTLQKEHPDVARLLTQPIWYFDRKGEKSVGQEDWIRTAVFYLEKGDHPRVYSK